MIAPAKDFKAAASLKTMDGNEAAASIAYRVSETIAIYPITPSTPMGELSDEWAAHSLKNVWGDTPSITQMQSEAGVAGALHGLLQAGSMSTSFTASQGLLLMIPDMLKIAGEMTPFVLHVAARTLATHALSIFGDHSDVMAVRSTGFAMLAGANPQEAHDLALVSHAATLKARIPFLHFFDGFRTSHELNQVSIIPDEAILNMLDAEAIQAHYSRALTPDAPKIRGTAHNPDTYFQAREAANTYYDRIPEIVQAQMDQLAEITGRSYQLFDYLGDPDAETVVIAMGSGAETVAETVRYLNAQGRKVGVVHVHLFRPFSAEHFIAALPASVQRVVVLDRTKEPGAPAEPLHQDVVSALHATGRIMRADGSIMPVLGGRYGLSSKEFTPAMVQAVFDNAESESPKTQFTVGINDDITHLSLSVDDSFEIENDDTMRALFYGLGSDGTVGANKNTIKILGDQGKYAQGYFVYDSKKSGAMTISHLRFGPEPIKAAYLIRSADFIGCHQWSLMERYDVLATARQGATFLLNSAYDPAETWDHLPREVQQSIVEKDLNVYVIDAYQVARDTGMGGRINTIMQTCFFAVSEVIPKEDALEAIKEAIRKTYSKKGDDVVQKNIEAVNQTVANLHAMPVPTADSALQGTPRPPIVSAQAPDFVQRVTATMMRGEGDLLPVSAFPVDGTWPTGTARWEKRTLAQEAPVWDSSICIQCNKCAMVCPHAAIRTKFYPEEELKDAPAWFQSVDFRSKDHPKHKFTIQLAPDDCTGCSLCVMVCPAKDKTHPKHKALDIAELAPVLKRERENFDFFLELPEADRTQLDFSRTKDAQFAQPLFEFSGACAGCGETPYLKLLTQLSGDRAIIANATGCSSIYGGNLPTTPYTSNAAGRGPAWSNSLFEDNAEYGFGMRVAVDMKETQARTMLLSLRNQLSEVLVDELLDADQTTEAGIVAQRQRVADLRQQLNGLPPHQASRLNSLADYLVRKSVWIVGGDGWAYDIGFGGLDHVMSQGRNVNILVMDTEVYSNTGGQASKATPMGAVAKFAADGKGQAKKDLGLLAMSYGNVYVARVAFGANDTQTAKALAEADAYPGTSLIIAYSHCIAHGYSLTYGLEQQKRAVQSGYWPLYRFDPRNATDTVRPLKLDSQAAKIPVGQFMENETRFRILQRANPARAKDLTSQMQQQIHDQRSYYERLAKGEDIKPLAATEEPPAESSK